MPSSRYTTYLAGALLSVLVATLLLTIPGASADDYGDMVATNKKSELKYPNLGSLLNQLVSSVEEGRASAQDTAGRTSIFQGESIAVTIHLAGHADDVVSFLEDNGGYFRNAGEDYIETYMPVSQLSRLSELSGVIRVREIIPPQPEQISQQVIGNGPAVHGSLPWNLAGNSGEGVKLGVINAGFLDFSGLKGDRVAR